MHALPASTRFTVAASLFISATFVSRVAFAGAVMEMTDKDLQNPQAKPDTQVIAVQDGRLRMENHDAGGGSSITLFRDQAIYHIEPGKKRYQKIDKAQMEQLGGQLAQARKQMEERMAKMPPEQRQMMEQAMSRMGGGAAAAATRKKPVVTTRDTGRGESVGGYSCRVWEVTIDGKKENELCVAAPGSLPGGNDLLQAMRQMGEMAKGLAQGLGGLGAHDYWGELTKLNGVPILTRDFDSAGKPDSETRLTSVKSQSLPAAMFEVPAGYKEQKIGIGKKSSSDDDSDDDDNN